MYNFLFNMWVMKKIDESYLSAMVDKRFITAKEKGLIITTPQVDSH